MIDILNEFVTDKYHDIEIYNDYARGVGRGWMVHVESTRFEDVIVRNAFEADLLTAVNRAIAELLAAEEAAKATLKY